MATTINSDSLTFLWSIQSYRTRYWNASPGSASVHTRIFPQETLALRNIFIATDGVIFIVLKKMSTRKKKGREVSS